MIHKLVFDATDADTIQDSANVGAFLRSADGTLLTHTDVGGKKALDVRVAEGINVEVDLDAADDSVAAWLSDGAGNAISSTGGALHISDAGGSITVDATNLDIRDLAFATDKVDVSGSEVSLDAATLAALENITVSATDLDIRDLDAATDSVQSNLFDGAGNAITSTTGFLDVNIAAGSVTTSDAALANTAISAIAETVTTSSAAILDGGDLLSGRKYAFLYNNGNRTVFVGPSGVTTSSGFPIPAGSILEARIGAAVALHMVAASGSQNVRTLQLS
jgi:hypothetical protein